jgi:hypothetical protein
MAASRRARRGAHQSLPDGTENGRTVEEQAEDPES